jgi:uncharacterized membrane protein YeiH
MNTLIKTIEIIGIIAFALTGIYEARKKGMDLIGVYAVAMITAFGGGSLRDIMLDRHPLFWIEHYEYAILLLVLSLVTTCIIRDTLNRDRVVQGVLALDALGLGLFSASGASVANQLGCHPFVSVLMGVTTGMIRDTLNKDRVVRGVLVLDALGLGLFSASGASVANQLGCHPFVSVLMGVTTGVFGGVLRDIICNEIPHVFTRTELYATCAFAGACSYLVVFSTTENEFAAVISCIAITFILRMFAIRYKIRLPI